jgi:hypothetical protein
MNELESIVSQLQRQRDAIDKALEALRGVTGSPTSQSAKQGSSKRQGAPTKKRRTISAEGRLRMAEAQQKRWAAKRSTEKKAPKKTA